MSDKPLDWIGKLPEAVREWLAHRRVEEVECVIPDMAGISRGKAMPSAKFARGDRIFLPNSIFYQTIDGGYVDIDDKDQWTESDIVLRPVYASAVASPWASDVTIQVMHDCVDTAGKPTPVAPRNVLKRVVDLFHKDGWLPVVAPEMEFYLTKPNTDPDLPIEPPIGRTGRVAASRQSYSMSAVDEYGPVIDDIYDFAEAQGFEIDTIIQEGGAGQIEINFYHGDPLALADQVFFFKRAIREAAYRHDCFATFMAKPMQHEPGSAMHIHQSVVDARTGRNIFNDADDRETPEFLSFVAGLQKFLPNVIPMVAPYVNSYRRYVAGNSAPINLEWGYDNRTTGLRVPVSDPAARRIENRIVGMDANPYLAFAASLACGYLGLKKRLKPRKAMKGDAYDHDYALPRGLLEALDAFEANDDINDILGLKFCDLYKALKRNEAENFLAVISPWEREHLLLSV
jgi:glutamine synthetase